MGACSKWGHPHTTSAPHGQRACPSDVASQQQQGGALEWVSFSSATRPRTIGGTQAFFEHDSNSSPQGNFILVCRRDYEKFLLKERHPRQKTDATLRVQ